VPRWSCPTPGDVRLRRLIPPPFSVPCRSLFPAVPSSVLTRLEDAGHQVTVTPTISGPEPEATMLAEKMADAAVLCKTRDVYEGRVRRNVSRDFLMIEDVSGLPPD